MTRKSEKEKAKHRLKLKADADKLAATMVARHGVPGIPVVVPGGFEIGPVAEDGTVELLSLGSKAMLEDAPPDNLLAQKGLRFIRDLNIQYCDPMPRPKYNHPHKKDKKWWRPLYEWYQRHQSETSISEIARQLGPSRDWVRRKFEECANGED